MQISGVHCAALLIVSEYERAEPGPSRQKGGKDGVLGINEGWFCLWEKDP